MEYKVRVALRGCDDTTYMELTVDEAGYNLLTYLEATSTKLSHYPCMPTLLVTKLTEEEE